MGERGRKDRLVRRIERAVEREIARLDPRVWIEEVIVNVTINVNNIRVSDSQVGVLNTGSISDIESIDVNVGALRKDSLDDIADALRHLTEAVAAAGNEATTEQKQELLELIALLSDQARTPEGERKRGPIKAAVGAIPQIAGTLGGIAGAWSTWGPTILRFFGL